MTIDLENLQKQKAAELLAERDAAVEEVTTAFLIVQNKDGQWAAYADYEGKEVIMDRQATLDDIIGGCENVKIGAQTQQAAISTIIMMEQRAAQMQHQMQMQQEASRVASLIDPNKLRA
jgi:hypothetical protein